MMKVPIEGGDHVLLWRTDSLECLGSGISADRDLRKVWVVSLQVAGQFTINDKQVKRH